MKIVFTGPECSGKTELSTLIANQFGVGYVREVAREYLEQRDNTYDYEDLVEIAKLQHEEELNISVSNNNTCADTDLLTIIIWSEEKFGKVDPIIPALWKANIPDLYFLCTPDIPWTYDPQRENPYDRDRLFDIHKNILLEHNLPFYLVAGDLENRVAFVSDILKDLFLLKDR